MTEEERQRIEKQYGVSVPKDIEVQHIPKGVAGMPANFSRREAYERSRKVTMRKWKFQAAERKRASNKDNTK